MKKKILIVGNDLKEYALAKKLSENYEIYITPSSDPLREFANCLDIREDNIKELMEFVMENDISMTIATSQKAIEADIASIFESNKLPVFAPSSRAAEIVYNKALAKKTLYKLRIQTPKFAIFDKVNIAADYIKNQQVPFVIKTNENNSATVITSLSTARNITEYISLDKNNKIIIEDYKYGSPFSFYTLTDGYKALPIGSSLTYKHLLEGDGGQLTGGMGALSPNYKLSFENECFIMDNIIYPTLEYLERSGNTYTGIFGINGILSDDGLSVLGWQSFMQNCDAAAILNNLDEDLYNLFESCIVGSFSDDTDNIKISDRQSVSVVLRCSNKENKENVIKGLDNLEEDTVISFAPSVKKNKYLEFEADNGIVMSATCSSSSLAKASEKLSSELSDISFNGIFYRKDICSLKLR